MIPKICMLYCMCAVLYCAVGDGWILQVPTYLPTYSGTYIPDLPICLDKTNRQIDKKQSKAKAKHLPSFLPSFLPPISYLNT